LDTLPNLFPPVGVFQRPGSPTLADVSRRIFVDSGLSEKRRRDVCSAINTMAKAANGTLEELLADPMVLRRRTAEFHPAHARISHKRWQNVKADVIFALRRYGPKGGSSRLPLQFTPPWQHLADSTTDNRIRWCLSRLFHYCSALGLEPSDVCQQTLVEFHKVLAQESLIGNPGELVRRTARVWNKAARTVPGWPTMLFEVVDQRDHYTIPIEEFPETFQADVARFLDRVGSLKPFRRDGLKRSFPRPCGIARIRSAGSPPPWS
jgi:hypothetical protein